MQYHLHTAGRCIYSPSSHSCVQCILLDTRRRNFSHPPFLCICLRGSRACPHTSASCFHSVSLQSPVDRRTRSRPQKPAETHTEIKFSTMKLRVAFNFFLFFIISCLSLSHQNPLSPVWILFTVGGL